MEEELVQIDYEEEYLSPPFVFFGEYDVESPNGSVHFLVFVSGRGEIYLFERNNPYKYTDKDGNIAVLVPILIGAVVSAVVNTAAYAVQNILAGEAITGRGLGVNFVGGFVGGAVGTTVGLLSGGNPAAIATGLAAEASVEQIAANIAENRPWSEGISESVVISLLSFGIVDSTLSSLLPSAAIGKIKYPLSYLTTKTGQTFIANTLIQETSSAAIESAISPTITPGTSNAKAKMGTKIVTTKSGVRLSASPGFQRKLREAGAL